MLNIQPIFAKDQTFKIYTKSLSLIKSVFTICSQLHIYRFLKYLDVINHNENKYIFHRIKIFGLKLVWLIYYEGNVPACWFRVRCGRDHVDKPCIDRSESCEKSEHTHTHTQCM